MKGQVMKKELIARILSQSVYLVESGLWQKTAKALEKLSIDILEALEVIIAEKLLDATKLH